MADAVHTALQRSMVVGEHEAQAALLALLLAATSGGCGPQPQCSHVKGEAACRIACRAACCHGLGMWEMPELCNVPGAMITAQQKSYPSDHLTGFVPVTFDPSFISLCLSGE